MLAMVGTRAAKAQSVPTPTGVHLKFALEFLDCFSPVLNQNDSGLPQGLAVPSAIG
jgi:hypothetical protein